MITLSLHANRQRARVACYAPTSSFFENRSQLDDTLKAKRLAVAQIEAAWVAAAETVVAHGLPRSIEIADRSTWDRTTWQRYLDAATACELEFKPRIMRLLNEIDAIERSLTVPPTAKAA